MLWKNSQDISVYGPLCYDGILVAAGWCAHAVDKIAMSVILRDRSPSSLSSAQRVMPFFPLMTSSSCLSRMLPLSDSEKHRDIS
jgi:hypothetical protein